MLPVEVAVHHHDHRVRPVKLRDKGGHDAQTGSLRRAHSPVTGDDLVFALPVVQGPDQQRGQNPILPDALGECVHFRIILYLIGMIRKSFQFT